MTYSNDPNWRKFMDAKWRELAQSQKERDNFDVIQRTKFPTSMASIPVRGQAVRAQPKAAPANTKVDYKAAREDFKQGSRKLKRGRSLRKRVRRYTQKKVVHEFDMPAAGKDAGAGQAVNPEKV